MLLSALSFLAGISFIQRCAELPSASVTYIIAATLFLVLVIWLAFRSRPYSWVFQASGFVLAGVLWATMHGQNYLDHRLPEELAGQEFYVEGIIEEIPFSQDAVQRFVFSVLKFEGENRQNAPKKLRLSWYYGGEVNAGERWRFLVRLKPPHGFLNPGGFDYEGWLFQHRIHATGYVRKSHENSRLQTAGIYSIDALRQGISSRIQAVLADEPHSGLVTALSVGDRAPISKAHWGTLINTGTNHLMAISGLHIGLAAAFGYWLTRRLAPHRVMKSISAQQTAICCGLLVAVIYALLAGLSIPTQRALLMLSCIAGAVILKRNFRALDALSTALLMVLIWDPVSILSAGFWFSFLAVFVIFYVFSGRVQPGNRWKQWGWMQLAIALGLFPVSLLLFQQTSLVSPLANLVMVPYVSFLVVPLVLMSLLVMPVSTVLSDLLLITASYLLEAIWPFLTWLSENKFAYWAHASQGLLEVMLALLGIFLLLAPRGVPARWLSVIFILPILSISAPKPVSDSYEFTLLDVGQGLAVVVRTRNHVLVFDTGNRFGDRLDAGEAVIVPYLRKLSVDKIDRLVISHGDSDHIGGAKSILSGHSVAQLIGQDIENLDHPDKKLCFQGEQWEWDGIVFEFIHPDTSSYKKRNNRSCVLKISGPGGSLLLTGDIEKKVENRLLAGEKNGNSDLLKADVLLVPHHGSKTSSTKQFIEAVNPKIVLFPVGYRNRYRLPNRGIVDRYHDSGADLYSSGHSGAIRVQVDPVKGVSIADEYRKTNSKYWNHDISFQ